MSNNTVDLFGYASDVGGAKPVRVQGADVLKDSPYLASLAETGIELQWGRIVKPDNSNSSKLTIIHKLCHDLGSAVSESVVEKRFFTVFGGDHSCGIGTWSGVSNAKQSEGPIGLIWIDAHMDSHTPQTSDTGNLHGMPVACLLGHGEPLLTQLFSASPKIKPENICLIGIRSFEPGEEALLNKLGVRIFFMDEVKQRGLNAVMQDAIKLVTQHTIGFGVSLDIDSIDPVDAPGTGVAEPDGIPAKELLQSLTLLAAQPQLLGAEIAEFDPGRDKNHITEKLIAQLFTAITKGI